MKSRFIIIFSVILLSFILLGDTNSDFIRPHYITIKNQTTYIDACYISYILSYEIFEIDTLELLIYYTTDSDFYGFLSQIPFGEHRYLLLIKPNLNDNELKETLSHEFIHINQYETGRLKSFGNIYIWEGDTIKGNNVLYNDRPFEKEAYKNQSKILRKLNRKL